MTQKPLDNLKKGFSKLSQRVKKKTDDLYAKLSQQEAISSADEQWLDGEGNTVDEQRILDILESASDYEQGVAQLDDNGQAIVKRLRELASDLPNKVAAKKTEAYTLISEAWGNSDYLHLCRPNTHTKCEINSNKRSSSFYIKRECNHGPVN